MQNSQGIWFWALCHVFFQILFFDGPHISPSSFPSPVLCFCPALGRTSALVPCHSLFLFIIWDEAARSGLSLRVTYSVMQMLFPHLTWGKCVFLWGSQFEDHVSSLSDFLESTLWGVSGEHRGLHFGGVWLALRALIPTSPWGFCPWARWTWLGAISPSHGHQIVIST